MHINQDNTGFTLMIYFMFPPVNSLWFVASISFFCCQVFALPRVNFLTNSFENLEPLRWTTIFFCITELCIRGFSGNNSFHVSVGLGFNQYVTCNVSPIKANLIRTITGFVRTWPTLSQWRSFKIHKLHEIRRSTDFEAKLLKCRSGFVPTKHFNNFWYVENIPQSQ